METLFWFCVGVLAYTYVGYPAIVGLLSLARKSRRVYSPAILPSVSLIISAYNEERAIVGKLVNSLTLIYPTRRLEIIVASDGSTDSTDALVRKFERHGVRLMRVEGRQGKTAVQNVAAALATGEILVFSDANAIYQPDAIRRLVSHFSDPSVGCVEGRRVDFTTGASSTGQHELTYRNWESRIKQWEGRALSCTGATGPIYAVRRALYVPLDPTMISDLMEPMLIMTRHGKRHVFEPDAISREIVLDRIEDEYHRKVRIMTRCLNSLRLAPEILNPFRNGSFALQVISHRLLRWLCPLFAVVAMIANVWLLPNPIYRAAFVLEMLFLLSAAIGVVLDQFNIGPVFLRLPRYFCAANLAALDALGNCILGRKITTWQPDRGEQFQQQELRLSMSSHAFPASS